MSEFLGVCAPPVQVRRWVPTGWQNAPSVREKGSSRAVGWVECACVWRGRWVRRRATDEWRTETLHTHTLTVHTHTPFNYRFTPTERLAYVRGKRCRCYSFGEKSIVSPYPTNMNEIGISISSRSCLSSQVKTHAEYVERQQPFFLILFSPSFFAGN